MEEVEEKSTEPDEKFDLYSQVKQENSLSSANHFESPESKFDQRIDQSDNATQI